MKALRPYRGDVKMANIPAPSPNAGETVVEVRAISLNRGELHRLQSAGRDDWRPGWDFAGVVAQPVDDDGAGRRVFGAVPEAAWAEFVAVPTGFLAPLPAQLSFVAGAALPVAGLTALRILELGGPLDGARVLVVGAAGGAGRFAVQLACRAGARVTAVVGDDLRVGGLAELGASEVVVGVDAVGGEYDLILESAGGESLARALAVVAPGGTVVSFGNSSRAVSSFDVGGFYPREAALRGFYLWRDTERRPPAEDLAELARLVVAGQLVVDVDLCLPWHDAAAALAALRARDVAGKAVLIVSGEAASE